MLRFMKYKIIIPTIIIGILAAFFSFNYDTTKSTNAEDEQKMILQTVMNIIARGHYAPKPIDDSFSTKAFHTFFENLDYDKKFFLKSDIDNLKKYQKQLDDELKNNSIDFFNKVNELFKQRVDESESFYKTALAKPYTFDTKDSINLDGKKLDYCKNNTDLAVRWDKAMKYRVLLKFTDLKENEDKKVKDSVNYTAKTDIVLEKEARDAILKVQERYFKRLKKLTDTERFALYVNSLTGAMDPHTDYMLPQDKKRFDEMMSGGFIGIGAGLQQTDEGNIKITSLVTGSPAWKTGKLKVEDVIKKVGQGEQVPVEIEGMEIDEVIKLIRGKKGTEVKLTVKHQDGSSEVISIVRDQVASEETFAKSAVIEKDGKKIGYIYLPEFYADFSGRNTGRRSGSDVLIEVEKLKSESVEGIILDLRNNGGGSLTDVVEMSGIFLGSGPVVQVRSNGDNISQLKSKSMDALYDGPLAIMINVGSASASEILAAVMQDYKRAVIVGTTSFGKGTVQNIVPLDQFVDARVGKQILEAFNRTKQGESDFDGIGSLKLTINKFYRVNGGSTQLKGVTPDIVLPDAYELIENIGERKDPSALPWDKIAAARYPLWTNQPNFDLLRRKSEARVKSDETFKLIRKTGERLKNQQDNYIVPLNQIDYAKYLEVAKSINKELEEIEKNQPHNITILNPSIDLAKINVDSSSISKNADWLKSLKKDVFVFETSNIIVDMIGK